MKKLFSRLVKEESGQGMTEYGLILALIGVAAIVALIFMGGKIKGIFNKAGNELNDAAK